MHLLAADKEATKRIVRFNGKVLESYIAANDEEGWVEVLNLSSPLFDDEADNATDDEIEFLPLETKKLFGLVEIESLDK